MIPDEALEANCPIEYDHAEDLEECMVCGWGAPVEKTPARGPRDMATLTGSERIQEAIDRLNGAYAPQRRILFTCRPNDPTDV